eukprot:TRINITY_DN3421_c0_g3_i1.p1 TRINITY_DN3421_c0_g3~~TRINITY_DN3421_c0_g3_i1.p1  ORF type:complete len:239 (+),score=55.62 TRINITY_DN3421_c0_g3_i1:523-1239(+)
MDPEEKRRWECSFKHGRGSIVEFAKCLNISPPSARMCERLSLLAVRIRLDDILFLLLCLQDAEANGFEEEERIISECSGLGFLSKDPRSLRRVNAQYLLGHTSHTNEYVPSVATLCDFCFSLTKEMKKKRSEHEVDGSQQEKLVSLEKRLVAVEEKCFVLEKEPCSDDEIIAELRAKLKVAEKRIEDELLCQVCFEKNRDTLFMPCMHMVCCSKCVASADRCPVCRSPKSGVITCVHK